VTKGSTDSVVYQIDWSLPIEELYQFSRMRGLWAHADFYQEMFKISTRKVCPEMLLFLRDYNELNDKSTTDQSQLQSLYNTYICKDGAFELNLPITSTRGLHHKIKLQEAIHLTDFTQVFNLVEVMIFDNIFIDYVLTKCRATKDITVESKSKTSKESKIIKSQPML